MGDNLKTKVVHGAIWAYLERFSVQGMQFVVGMILARLLTPADYGTLAIMMSAVFVLGLIGDCGISRALVQKKEISETDANTVFYFNLGLTLLLYLGLFLAAPLFVSFYGDPRLCPALRTIGLMMIFSSLDAVQNVMISREFKFNLSFRISLAAMAAQGATGIALAYLGYGVWALVFSTLAGSATGTAMRIALIRWRPRLLFSLSSLRGLFGYGWKLMVGSIVGRSYSYIYDFVIGKIYSRADLGVVNKAKTLPGMLVYNLEGSLMRAVFPAFTKMQDDPARLKKALSRTFVAVSVVVYPFLMLGMVAASRVIELLYGSQWVAGAPFFAASCYCFALISINRINEQAVNAVGRTDVSLRNQVTLTVIELAILAIFARDGLWRLTALTCFGSCSFMFLVISWSNGRVHGYTILEQFRDLAPTVAVLALIAAPVYFVGTLFDGHSPIELVAALAAETALAAALYLPYAIFRLRRIR